jgi:hypothetical protein
MVRVIHNAGPDGIQLDVALACEQVAVRLHERCLVPALPERSGSIVKVVEVAHVSPAQRLHRCGQRGRPLRRGEQVHVVRHEDVGVDSEAMPGGQEAQALVEVESIAVGPEDRLPVVAAHHDVHRRGFHEKAREACHPASTRRQGAASTEM